MTLNMSPSQYSSNLVTRASRQPLAALGVLLLALFVVCAVFAPWIAPRDPAQLDLAGRLLAPGHGHWFGTDELGRDILSRTLYGARISLVVALSVVSLSLGFGLIAGLAAGFYGGWTDTVLNVYVTNAFLALPGILLAIAFVAFLGPGLFNLILALSISGWVGYARLCGRRCWRSRSGSSWRQHGRLGRPICACCAVTSCPTSFSR